MSSSGLQTTSKVAVKLRSSDLSSFFNQLNTWREQKIFCDFQLRSASGDCQWVHKLVILAASPGLHATKIITPILDLPCSTQALTALVHFMYGEEVGVSPDIVFELKLCAEALNINSLVVECDSAMQRLAHSAHEQLHRLHQPPSLNTLIQPPLSSYSNARNVKVELGDCGGEMVEVSLYNSQRRASMPAAALSQSASTLRQDQLAAADSTSTRDSSKEGSREAHSDNEADELRRPCLKRKMSSEQMPLRKRGLRPEVDVKEETTYADINQAVNVGSPIVRTSSSITAARPFPPRQMSADELLGSQRKESVVQELQMTRPRGTLTAKLEMIRQANKQLMGDYETKGLSGRLSQKLKTIRAANEELLKKYPSQARSLQAESDTE